MLYQEYKDARDAAWEALIHFGVDRLPVRVSSICREAGFTLRSYQAAGEFLCRNGLEEQAHSSDGFALRRCGVPLVFYNGAMVPGRIRFTIAHELGHIFLGHLSGGLPTGRNREPRVADPPIEQQANVFASRLLAPAIVLHEIGARTPQQIALACDISMQAATFRAGRLGVLEERNRFESSPLERKVRRQFDSYIRQLIT